MGDADHDQKSERVILTYSEKVKHAADSDGKYPFTVAGYKVTRVASASGKTLTLLLKEKLSADGNAKPSVKYTRTSADPVKDLAGNQAAGQTYADTFPLLAIFVSPTGNDANPGTQSAPKLTVPNAITEAGNIGALDVYLASGTYAGPIHPSGNMTVAGGFTASFVRSDAAASKALLTGAKDVDTGQFGTVFVLDLAGTMSLVRLTIEGPDATDPGATSYAVVVRNSDVVIKKSRIVAGDGADGSDGGDGANAITGISAAPAMDGGDGGGAVEFSAACDTTSHGAGGGAGANSSAPAGGLTFGGGGGAGGEMDTTCNIGLCDNCNATKGDDGLSGGQAGGSFGGGGAGGPGQNACFATGGGEDGESGLVTNGAAGSGASGGSMSGFFWAPRNGTAGAVGENGGGGGGGGGSGGCDTGIDSYGAGGGGGGAGGARAQSGGDAGTGGGSSFAVLVYSATAFEASVSITRTKLIGGVGGDGGAGGSGGEGQAGGLGGAAGGASGDSAAGGAGGDGGHGGHGGGGGGGAGGYSYLIYSWQSTITQSGNTFTAGSAGLGGAGGDSPGDGNDGGQGSVGQVGNIGSCSLLLIC